MTADLFDPETTMPALSLWQPWASLWACSAAKVHETRSWPLKVPPGGMWLAVHAALRIRLNEIGAGSPLPAILDRHFGLDWMDALPTGAFIGCVFVTECWRVEQLRPRNVSDEDRACGDYRAGRFAFRRSEQRIFRTPVPWRGRQRLFRVPLDALPEFDRKAA